MEKARHQSHLAEQSRGMIVILFDCIDELVSERVSEPASHLSSRRTRISSTKVVRFSLFPLLAEASTHSVPSNRFDPRKRQSCSVVNSNKKHGVVKGISTIFPHRRRCTSCNPRRAKFSMSKSYGAI